MRGFRVLLVEDNVLVNLEVSEFLREQGIHVVQAYCASAAFETIARHEHLSALVTDIDLGPGPDGFEVARRARAGYPGLSVVFISGTAASRHEAEGVDGSVFIRKPFDSQAIVEAFRFMTPAPPPLIAPIETAGIQVQPAPPVPDPGGEALTALVA